jgi:hypothetical protein
MSSNYDGLTRNIWPGTWSTGTNAPIALDTELRGTLQSISGDSGDKLTNIPGARIQEGMLVYLKTGYTAGGYTRAGDTYFTYKLGVGESRSAITGAVPNAEANWSEVSFASGVSITTVTTSGSNTNETVIDTINPSSVRSVQYEAQVSCGSSYQATELKLLISQPNAFLTEYAMIGSPLGNFNSYYSPATNNYSGGNINNGGVSVWNGTNLRVYTSNTTIQLALLSANSGTIITGVDSTSSSYTATLSSSFTETSSGIYDASTSTNQSPAKLLNSVVWTGTGNVELRFTPNNTSTTIKFITRRIS